MSTPRFELHDGDVGTIIRRILKNGSDIIDISDASSMELIVKKPDLTTATWQCSLYTDGTDGAIQYITQSGDIDQTGGWQMQAHVTTLSGEWKSDIENFAVLSNL